MSFFTDLFKSLETHIEEEFAVYKNEVYQMISQENQVLRSLGIQLPWLISDLSYTTNTYTTNGEKEVYVKLNPPKFQLQPHRVFNIDKYGDLVVTMFENLDQVNSNYSWWGLADAIKAENGAHIWTNRDPYAFYRALEVQPKSSTNCKKPGDFTAKIQKQDGVGRYSNSYNIHCEAAALKPLRVVRGLSSEEAAEFDLRARLYNSVVKYGYGKKQEDFYSLENPIIIPKDIRFSLPVPSTWLTAEYTCVKILPSALVRPAQVVEFLNSLRDINHFFSFELLRGGESICFRLQAPTDYIEQIAQKMHLYFPGVLIVVDDPAYAPLPYHIKWLKKPLMYESINRLRDFQIDPYAHFASIFDNAPGGDLLCYQVLFAPLLDEAASTLKNFRNSNRTYLLNDDETKRFSQKLPVWFVSINVSSTNKQLAARVIESAARTFDTPEETLSDPISYNFGKFHFPQTFPAFISLLDTEELSALVHFPVTQLPINRLETVSQKTVEPPEDYTAGDTKIGEMRSQTGQTLPVTLPEAVRDRHVYIVGKSGTGKSTLMETIARRDIEAGRGVAVIDPHGDLVQHLLDVIPEHRVDDTILFSPKRSPFSLEILKAESEQEIDLLSDDLITMFRRTSESWGDKMQAILQMAFQTLLRVPGSSFTEITTLLTDENYRNRIIGKINHPQLAAYWQHRYDIRQAEPILIRMDRLTTSGILRQVLTQHRNSLNFYDVIQESKIFLADLSKGFLGESTSRLLGSIIVSQIQLAAMRQAHLPAEQRIAFSLFVDEVQNYTTSAFTTILSEARKQKLRLTIAHQFVSQLPTEIQKAVFGNVGTLVFFAMSPDDLGAARHELGQFEPDDVANLPKYNALCRPATAARDTFSFATDPPPPALEKRNFAQTIIENTLREYGDPAAAPFTETPQPAVSIQVTQPLPVDRLETIQPPVDRRRPMRAEPVSFPTNAEKILHFLRQAEYLSQPQIIALTELLPPNASTALKKLCETGQIKSLDDRRPKIYFVGRTCSATVHNLLIRDLWVKICASGYAVGRIEFNEQLSEINPDLAVEFVGEDTTPLLCYFELDRGTEGVAELVKKADRYASISESTRVCFVFERDADMKLARSRINYPFVSFAVLNDFARLQDEAFYAAGAATTLTPFFR